MKKSYKHLIYWIIAVLKLAPAHAQSDNLYIEGVIDGPLAGGTPKAIHLCSNDSVPNLAIYGIETANNGNNASGPEFIFPPHSINPDECIWVSNDSLSFLDWFDFNPCYVSSSIDGNGDDTYILYYNGFITDVYGIIGQDGTGQNWEYLDGWANALDTVPDTLFVISDWQVSGINALDGETSNSMAAVPYPNDTINCITALEISISDISIQEGNDSTVLVDVLVELDAPALSQVEFMYSTIDSTATSGENDYTPQDSILVIIPQGLDSSLITVEIVSDTIQEPDEIFLIKLFDLSSNVFFGDSLALVTVINDDGLPSNCPSVWINEFHYDNNGVDSMEFIEIASPIADSIDLLDFKLRLYDGSTQLQYGGDIDLINYSAAGTDSLNNYFAYDISLQNGSPDGLLLFDCTQNEACAFISYEGSFNIAATDSLFANLISQDVLVQESNTTLPTESLQRTDNNLWFGPHTNTYASNNILPCTFSNIQLTNAACISRDFDFQLNFDNVTGSGIYILINQINGDTLAFGNSPLNVSITNNNYGFDLPMLLIDSLDNTCVSDTIWQYVADCIPDGINCWDSNMNGINDPLEDINLDGIYNTDDCQGAPGMTDGNGIYTGSGSVADSTAIDLAGKIEFENGLFTIDAVNGRIGIGHNEPSYELQLSGDLALSGNINGLSDARLKTDIKQIRFAIETIKKLKPVSFYFKDTNKEDEINFGLLAQELEEILPELVTTNNSKEELKSINYLGLIPILIAAVKDQQKQIDYLSSELLINK